MLERSVRIDGQQHILGNTRADCGSPSERGKVSESERGKLT